MSRDIISKPSGWLLYSGITMISISVLISFSVAIFIAYPDTVQGTAIFAQKDAPIEIISKLPGVIDSIYISDNTLAKKGDIIAISDHTVHFSEIIKIESYLNEIPHLNKKEDWVKFKIDSVDAEIPIGDGWNTLLKALTIFKTDLASGILQKESTQVHKEISQTAALNKSLGSQLKIFSEELKLNKKERDRKLRLLKQGAISESDFEKEEALFLNQKRQMEMMKSTKINYDVRITNLQTSLIKLKEEYELKLRNEKTDVFNLLLVCKNLVQDWRKTHMYIAPIDGKFVLAETYSSKPFLQGGQLIGTLIPPNKKTKILAYTNIPSTNLIDITEGVDVQLILQSYPSAEYGYLKGKVSKIALLPTKNEETAKKGIFEYLITIELPDSLISSTGQKIQYKPNMVADIKIFTKNKSILSQLLSPIQKLLKRRMK